MKKRATADWICPGRQVRGTALGVLEAVGTGAGPATVRTGADVQPASTATALAIATRPAPSAALTATAKVYTGRILYR